MDTKTALADALESIGESRPLDSIHIREILEVAGVSKQTFYRHFRDKYDLMEYCIRRMYDDTFGKMGINYPLSKCCIDLYDRYRQKMRFLQNVFSSTDMNGATGVIRRLVRETYAKNLELQGVKDEGDVAFALDLVVFGGVEMTRRWVMQGMPMSNKELAEMWVKVMPNNIAPYFH